MQPAATNERTMTRARAAVKGEPSPQAEAVTAPRKWDPIVPLADLPTVPAFPLGSLPGELAEFVQDVAGATNTPVDLAASFAVAVAAGAMGATRACEIKKGHVQRASVYLAGVAKKGGGKSPALDAVAKPLYDEQARLRKSGDREKKVFTVDVTSEKLAELMQSNPRGVTIVRDELAGWLSSFNQYKSGGKGGDRQFFLSAWSGSPISVDRKNKDVEPIYVRYPCLTVLGTIQPSVLDRFKVDADDGFYDRVLFCYPDELPVRGERWLTVSETRAGRWAEAVNEMRRTPMVEGDGGPRPEFLPLTDGAKAVWEAWTNDVASLVNSPDFDEVLRGPYVKLAGYAARLALVCRAAREGYGAAAPLEIDRADMVSGVDLAGYFLGHAVRAWAAVGTDSRFGPVRRLLRWVRESGVKEFTRRDAHRALVRSFQSAEDLSGPLRVLIQHGHLGYAESDGETKPAPGRPTTVYLVHPELCQRVNGVSASARPMGSSGHS